MESIEFAKKKMEIVYLENLIKACEKINLNKIELENKKNQLLSPNIVIETQEYDETVESPVNKQNDNDYLYHKPWVKLTTIHKIIKVKEYINQLLITNETDKEILKEKLITLIKNKVLTKKDTVLYDSLNSRIISIPSLEYKNGKYNI